jgi:hypothetical protein
MRTLFPDDAGSDPFNMNADQEIEDMPPLRLNFANRSFS